MKKAPPALTPEAERLGRLLWDYHQLKMRLKPADAILALGSNDPRVADHAADLWLKGYAPWLVCSGKVGALTAGLYGMSEAAFLLLEPFSSVFLLIESSLRIKRRILGKMPLFVALDWMNLGCPVLKLLLCKSRIWKGAPLQQCAKFGPKWSFQFHPRR